MYNRKARQVRTLQARVDRLVDQRDQATKELDAAVRLNGRLAAQLDGLPPDDSEIARLRRLATSRGADAQAAALRIKRLQRGAARYREQIGRHLAEEKRLRHELVKQRLEFMERTVGLEEELGKLQRANEQHYKDMKADGSRSPLRAA